MEQSTDKAQGTLTAKLGVLDRIKEVINNTFKSTMEFEVNEALKYQNGLKIKIDSGGINLDLESFLKNDEITKQAKRLKQLNVV